MEKRNGSTVEMAGEVAAQGIQKAASAIREGVDRVGLGRKMRRVADGAANGISDATSWVRTHNFRAMCRDVEHYVGRHPVAFLSAALVVGVLAGRAMNGKQHT